MAGGMQKWIADGRPLTTDLPVYTASRYPARGHDRFTFGWHEVLELSQGRKGVLIDVRPREYYLGEKSDEARAGHIPNAVNRPFSEDKYFSFQ